MNFKKFNGDLKAPKIDLWNKNLTPSTSTKGKHEAVKGILKPPTFMLFDTTKDRQYTKIKICSINWILDSR